MTFDQFLEEEVFPLINFKQFENAFALDAKSIAEKYGEGYVDQLREIFDEDAETGMWKPNRMFLLLNRDLGKISAITN